ncbi:MAG: hypothetical protein GXX84_17590 [Acidobacteria bacterium]|nr:hypothetical protein [Acidobacteriota bacterium]
MDRRGPVSFRELFVRPHKRRRSRGRRRTDRGAYVDIYDPRTIIIAIAVVLLSGMDAVITAVHLIKGTATELNPILERVISSGGLPAFFTVKAALTVIPIAIIVVHQEWALGRYAARLCLLSYALLSVYHIWLIIALGKSGTFFAFQLW